MSSVVPWLLGNRKTAFVSYEAEFRPSSLPLPTAFSSPLRQMVRR